MVNKQLVDYIRKEKEKGFSSEQIYKILTQNGHNPGQISEAIETVDSSQSFISGHKKFIYIGIPILLIMLISLGSLWYLTRPVCDLDLDCNDNIDNTEDLCINPSSSLAKCMNAEKTELKDADEEFSLDQEESISFNINNEDHQLEVEEVSEDSVSISIYSDPIKITLKIGQSKEVDVDGDGVKDVFVKLIKIIDGKPTFEIKSLEKSSKLTLEILPSKDSYRMGEDVSGEFKLSYTGEEFEGILLYIKSKDGFEDKFYTIKRGSISSGNIKNMELPFNAFRKDEHGFSLITDFFYDEGFYNYTLSVFTCEMTSSIIKKDCKDIQETDLGSLVPLKSISKVIQVRGGEKPYECRVNDDCRKICRGCNAGYQICSDEKCNDCIQDGNCRSGYKCRNKKCIEWECDKDIDCSDNDASTLDICTDNKCSRSSITECTDNDGYCPDKCKRSNDNDCTNKCPNKKIDCGTEDLDLEMYLDDKEINLTCFIDAAKNCCPAEIITNTPLVSEPALNIEAHREIKGLDDDECEVSETFEDISKDEVDEYLDELIDSGITEAEFDLNLDKRYEHILNFTLDKEYVCMYDPDDYVDILRDEEDKRFNLPLEETTFFCNTTFFIID